MDIKEIKFLIERIESNKKLTYTEYSKKHQHLLKENVIKNLSSEEQKTLDNILNMSTQLEEYSLKNSFYNFLKKQKLTLALLTALLASPQLSQAQKDAVNQIKTEMSVNQDSNEKVFKSESVTIKVSQDGDDYKLTIKTNNFDDLDVIGSYLYKNHKLQPTQGIGKTQSVYKVDKSNIDSILKTLKNLTGVK